MSIYMRQIYHKRSGLGFSLINENLVVKIHDIITWRCHLALLITIIISELVFYSIHLMDLELASTVIYLTIIFYIIRLFWSLFGVYLDHILFPDFPTEEENDAYRIQSLNDFNQVFVFIQQQIQHFYVYLKDLLQKPTLKVEIFMFSILCGLLIFFTIVGTFWFCYFVFHLILITHQILKIHSVRKYIEEKMQTQQEKAKTD